MNYKKVIFSLVGVIVLFTLGCEKEQRQKVSYRITNSVSGFDVNYLDVNRSLQTEKVVTQSAQDVWTYLFDAEKGDIVFVSAIYKDINSGIRIQILVNGKVFKEGSSTADTTKYLTVSGTIPY